MEIVHEAYTPCPCIQKINTFLAHRQQTGFLDLGPDSQIRCDCDQIWILQEGADGRVWVPIDPMPGYLK